MRPTGVVSPCIDRLCSDLFIQLGSHWYFSAFRGGQLDSVVLVSDLVNVCLDGDGDNFSLKVSALVNVNSSLGCWVLDIPRLGSLINLRPTPISLVSSSLATAVSSFLRLDERVSREPPCHLIDEWNSNFFRALRWNNQRQRPCVEKGVRKAHIDRYEFEEAILGHYGDYHLVAGILSSSRRGRRRAWVLMRREVAS